MNGNERTGKGKDKKGAERTERKAQGRNCKEKEKEREMR